MDHDQPGGSAATASQRHAMEGGAAPSEDEMTSGDALFNVSLQAKRSQVSAACQHCRKRKTKCDALRPCTTCAKKNLDCRYDTEGGETYSQAYKRKFEEMAESNDTYARIFDLIRRQGDRQTAEIVRWIKCGRSPGAILKFIDSGDRTSILPDSSKLARECLLVSLAHSTGSLVDITRLAALTLDPFTRITLPLPEEWSIFRNRIMHLSYVRVTARQLQLEPKPPPPLPPAPDATDHPRLALLEPERRLSGAHVLDGVDKPPYRVPAAPWTTVTTSDDAVSHLVSLFFSWINPAWRFVEQDLFLQGMRSQRLHSEFCSPFLVNCICAIASVLSEHEVAFVQPDEDRLARGLHFHDEAIRLWALEESHPTLTNIQGLCVLALECNYRAKDRLGLTFMPVASELNSALPMRADQKRLLDQGVSPNDYARARLAAHWSVKCTHVIMRIAFLSAEKPLCRDIDIPKIHLIFEDRAQSWTGYPLSSTIVHDRPTIYMRERCRLAEYFLEVHDFLYSNDKSSNLSTSSYASAVARLSTRMRQWYRHLPFELQYVWPMSSATWELHASYLSVLMVLHLAARTRFQQSEPLGPSGDISHGAESDQDEDYRSRLAQEELSRAIELAHISSQILRDFRHQYGLKISPAWLLHLEAVTASVLLLDPVLTRPAALSSPTAQDTESTQIQDSHTAFDEVFRCLMGSAVEVVISRGIARMIYHTALQQGVALSPSTRKMLQLMSETAWRPRDLSLVNSIFPNFVTTELGDQEDRLSELLLKWENLDV